MNGHIGTAGVVFQVGCDIIHSILPLLLHAGLVGSKDHEIHQILLLINLTLTMR